MALQQLIMQIQGLSGTDGDLDNLHAQLKQSPTENLMKANAAAILDFLQSIDMNAHSLGYLYLLEAKGRYATPPQGDLIFFQTTARFLTLCNPEQIRKAPRRFSNLCSIFRAQGVALGKPKHCILPLRAAVHALCPAPGSISPVHADYFLVCLVAKCYSAAALFLKEDACAVDPGATGVTATDILLYCYYGGMIETGRRRYSQAIDLYLTAVTVPTGVVNAITIASLKKLYLVSLLHTGEAPVLPKHTSPPVTRAVKGECAAYAELAKVAAAAATKAAGGAAGPSDLATYALSKSEVWRTDGNVGLVRSVVEMASRRKVQALTQTFCSLLTAAVAQRAGLPGAREAELELFRMVEAKEVSARISEREGVAEFLDNPGAYASAETVAELENLIEKCMGLSQAVAAVDHSVSCDRAFISKTDIGKGGGGGATPGLGAGGPSGMRGGSGGSFKELGGGGPGEGLPMASPVIGELLDHLDETMS